MPSYFVSDLHLDPQRPDIIEQFIQFNKEIVTDADAYYILGDFLEYWIGDDDPATGLQAALASVKAVADAGTPVYLMHGNRDFLIGKVFAQTYGITLIPDPTVITLSGQKTLLMHGDLLCIDDTAYQNFRAQVRNPQWQTAFLSKPIEERLQIVNSYLEISKRETSGKTDDIMDVNQGEVINIMQQHNAWQMIHGHTHRPGVHEFTVDKHAAKRIVLGDWYKTMTYLKVDKNGMEFI